MDLENLIEVFTPFTSNQTDSVLVHDYDISILCIRSNMAVYFLSLSLLNMKYWKYKGRKLNCYMIFVCSSELENSNFILLLCSCHNRN